MIYIKAEDFSIAPDSYITEGLIAMLDSLKGVKEEKTVIFPKGTYYIDSERCKKETLFITNTTGDREFSGDEVPHQNTVAMVLDGVSDLTLDGNGSVFVIDGKATNMALVSCENVVIKNLEIRHSHPDMHELRVVEKSPFTVDFHLDDDTLYSVEKGKLYFRGSNYRVSAHKNAKKAYWIGHLCEESPNKLERVRHPLAKCLKIKDLGDNKIRAYYINAQGFKKNDCYYIYDVRRQYAGIFVDRSKNITLQGVTQRFNYSLAIVAQDSENITVKEVDFSPEKKGMRKMASVADFMQFCMCRGKITVENSNFDGAGDDCINVHGIHFKIVKKDEKTITVRFMHPQTHGFNPIREGDEIAFINPQTLLEKGRARVLASKLLDEYEILLSLDSTHCATVGEAIENVTANPDFDFFGNTLNRIITRGILVTTRGRVSIEKNHFISTTMSGILLSDDAENWYESGMCTNVQIKNNTFDYCGETPVLIKPENKLHKGAVHKNIEITGNIFKQYPGEPISIKSSENILIKDNDFKMSKALKATNCENITKA